MKASKMETYDFSFGSFNELAQKSDLVLKDVVGFSNEGESQHDSLNAPSELEV
ncbi:MULTISPECIES: hypothetical protein [Cytobacillus]|jgi:hypothetical protein|uniref:hypothetical protein n=1 Tax=Cytobacillus TaxID=2675230 RepID=UPI0015875903|nr:MULTISPECIES: hypothetical protein [Cytobacillus]MBU8769626.1 hypothetical protein [Cytobacillus oceanisediminis]MCS0823993.1 hypothetical protein [Cytobacillus firmus]UQX55035.1 hypothetical protein M5V91_04480 [Cytobacillus pseudoceanisediminis]